MEHVGVVRVHDLVEHAGRPWIVMELLPGRTLAEVMRTDGPLPVPEVARIGLRAGLRFLDLYHQGVGQVAQPATALD